FVYKLVEREGADGTMQPVGKRSTAKATLGAGKAAYRMRVGERAHAELVLPGEEEVAEFERELIAELTSGESNPDWKRTSLRPLQQPLIVGGELLESRRPPARVEAARARHAASVAELGLSPEDGPDGPVAIPTLTDGGQAARPLGGDAAVAGPRPPPEAGPDGAVATPPGTDGGPPARLRGCAGAAGAPSRPGARPAGVEGAPRSEGRRRSAPADEPAAHDRDPLLDLFGAGLGDGRSPAAAAQRVVHRAVRGAGLLRPRGHQRGELLAQVHQLPVIDHAGRGR